MVKQSYTEDNYFKALNLDQDPFQSNYSKLSYYLTPELQHRLDLIKHLLEFSQQILLVKGQPKVGKTTFCRHLMTMSDTGWINYRLDATEEIGPDALVKAMLHEYEDRLEESSETIAALNSYLQHCNLNARVPVLLVDDADRLNQATLRFIFQLMEFRQQHTFVRVVLIGQESFLQRLNEVAEELSNTGLIHSITIPAFSLEQTAAYLRHRLAACGGRDDVFTEKEVAGIHKVAAGIAGDINFLARQGLSDPVKLVAKYSPAKTIETNNKNAAQIARLILASMIVTFAIVTLWLFLQRDVEPDIKTITVKLPPQPPDVAVEITHAFDPDNSAPLADAWLDNQLVDTSPELNKSVIAVTTETETETARDNVKQDEAINLVAEPVLMPSTAVETKSTGHTLPNTSNRIGSAITGINRGDDWLLAQPADYYVLQLISAVEIATITGFLQDTALDKTQLAVYRSNKSGKIWHVLVYGLYPELERARAAIATLPPKARAEKPWPKAMLSIHEAIKVP